MTDKTKNIIKWICIGIGVILLALLIGYIFSCVKETLYVLFGGATLASGEALRRKRKSDKEADQTYDNEIDKSDAELEKEQKEIRDKQLRDLAKTENLTDEQIRKEILKGSGGYVTLTAALIIFFFLVFAFLFSSLSFAQVCFSKSEARIILSQKINCKADLKRQKALLADAKRKCKAKIKVKVTKVKNALILSEEERRKTEKRLRIMKRALTVVGVIVIAAAALGTVVSLAKYKSDKDNK